MNVMRHQNNYFMIISRRIILLFVICLAACSRQDKHADAEQYTCPMHPTVVSDKPGACPVCGMELVRKARAGEEVKITEDLALLLKSPDESVVGKQQTIRGTYRSREITVEAHGAVTYDTRYVFDVPARIGGRLESVFVHYAFQPVRKGQKLFELYSPELLTAQEEFLYLVRSDPDNAGLVAAAREKLFLLGLSKTDVEELTRKGTTSPRFAITSPYSGYAMPDLPSDPGKTPVPEQKASSGMDAGGMSANPSTSTVVSRASMIHEGDYVSRGQRLLTIVSLEALRVELKVPSALGADIRAGDTLTVSLNNAQPTTARVDFVQPFYDQGEEFLKIRVYVRNADLQLAQLVEARIQRRLPELFWLPVEAVADLGSQKVVFVKDRGLFKPRSIVTGMRSDGWIEVRQGLTSSDEVAAKAAFLVDSESFIKTK